ncbi:MAG: hypothetical protein DRQ10_05535 [Candidatus Hydrothermota bacterium]|nr:MAG: hypothetical protein DRQ10_05535 [Candidatus Hydrothermae bacterium]
MLKNRETLESLVKSIVGDLRKALMIVGPRQVGKTSLMRLAENALQTKGFRTMYFDVERPEDFEILTRGADFVSRSYDVDVIFIDEVHKLPEWQRFVKLMVDYHSEKKLVLSSSNMAAVRLPGGDALVGRLVEFELYPLSFREYLTFREEERIKPLAADPQSAGSKSVLQILDDFIVFGGFPEVALKFGDEPQVSQVLSSIFMRYERYELAAILKDDLVPFRSFFALLAANIGNLLSHERLATELGLTVYRIKKFLALMEHTFLLKILRPFGRTKRKEITRRPKIYFVDTGLRNWAVRDYAPLAVRSDRGPLVENCVFVELLRQLNPLREELFFWRRPNGTEVDFVLKIDGQRLVAIEVKFTSMKTPKISKALRAFAELYSPEKVIVVTKDSYHQSKLGAIPVEFVPLAAFLMNPKQYILHSAFGYRPFTLWWQT